MQESYLKSIRLGVWTLAALVAITLIQNFYYINSLTDTYSSANEPSFKAKLSQTYLSGNLDQVIILSKERINKYPYDDYAHFYIGMAYYYKNNYDNAIISFKRSAELNPQRSGSVIEYLNRINDKKN